MSLRTASLSAQPTCESIFASSSPIESRLNFRYDAHSSRLNSLRAFALQYGVEYKPDYVTPFQFPYELMDPKYPLSGGFSVSKTRQRSDGFLKLTFHFETKGVKKSSLPPVTTPPVFSRAIAKDPALRGESWIDGTSRFHYFNPGKATLKAYGSSETVTHAAVEAARALRADQESREIVVPADPVWAKVQSVIHDRQVWASTRAINNYIGRKAYLDGESLFELRFHDLSTPNLNDLHILLRESGQSPLVMTGKEFEDSLAVVIRVARHNLETDSIYDLVTKGFGRDQLPHNSRLPFALRKAMRSYFDQLAHEGNLRIAELSRFNRLANVSEPAMDAFILKMFESTHTHRDPVDLFILECDDVTRRLFGTKYGFQTLAKISNDTNSGTAEGKPARSEFLMALDVRTSAYREMLQRLRNSAASIDRTLAPEPPPVNTWTSGWGDPIGFWDYSPMQKRRQMETRIDSVRSALFRFAKRLSPEKGASSEHSEQPRLGPSTLEAILNSPNRSLLFSEPLKKVATQLNASIGSQERILLVGQAAGDLETLLRSEYPERSIVTFPSVETAARSLNEATTDRATFDHVVLISALSADPATLDAALKLSFEWLKPNHQLTAINSFISPYEKRGDFDREAASRSLISSALTSGLRKSPQINNDLARLQHWYDTVSDVTNSVAEAPYVEAAGKVGFITDHRFGFSTSLPRYRAIILVKP